MSLSFAKALPDLIRRFLRDESGSITVFMLFMIPAIILTFAAGVDLTFLNSQRRYVQMQADLSAFSAARHLPDRAEAALAGKSVAQRNKAYGTIGVAAEDVQLGRFSPSTGFVEASTANPAVDAVRVRLRSEFRPMILKPFLGDQQLWVVKEAIVARQDLASFTLRNALLRLNTAGSPVLSALLSQQLGLNAALLSWQGLLGTSLSLTDLAGLISSQTGAQLLTFQDVLNAEVGLGALLSGLAARGVIPAAAIGAVPAVNVRLAEILKVSPEIAAMSVQGTLPDLAISAQTLLSALAQLSGSKTHHLVKVTTGLSVPPLTSPTLGLTLIDPGSTAIGQISAETPLKAEAAQVTLTASGEVAGLISLSAQLQAGAASATLTEVNCSAGGPNDIVAVVEVTTQPVTLALQVLLLEKPDGKTYSQSAPVTYAGQTQQITVRRSDLGKVISVPNTVSLASVTTALTTSLNTIRQDLNAEKNRLGLLGALVAVLLATVTNLLNSVTNLLANTALLNSAVQAFLDLLGIRLAQAELIVHGFDCRMSLVR